MALITWVVFNVTSILVPFPLSPGFYKWGYAIPAHEAYQVLTDIWSRGCNPRLHYALPILFALELTGLLLSGLGTYRRCHYALIAEEAQKAAFDERLNAAVVFERKRDEERREKAETENTPEDVERADEADREEIGDIIRKEDNELQVQKTKASKICGFGPSFDLAFEGNDRS
jgi:hypothetical protein